MAATSPTLLTLPRELRDQIYSYLTHEVQVSSVTYDRSVFTYMRLNRRTVYADNAPVVNVLRVHSRLRDEYLQAPCFTGLEITLYIDKATKSESTGQEAIPQLSKTIDIEAQFASLLRKAKHIRIILDCGKWGSCTHRLLVDHLAQHWFDIEDFANDFSNDHRSDPISSIKIAYRHMPHEHIPHALLGSYTELTAQKDPGPPPSSLGGIPLLQRAQGNRFTRIVFNEHPHWPDCKGYLVTQVGCYLYQCDEGARARLWDQDQVRDLWPDSAFQGPHAMDIKTEELAAQGGRPHLFRHRREMRGGEEAVTWFEH
jgi:hypothetical protein